MYKVVKGVPRLKKGEVYEHREGCRCFRCTGVAWNKGIKGEKSHMFGTKQPEWVKEMLSERMKKNNPMDDPEIKEKANAKKRGKHPSIRTEFKKGLIPWNKNLTKETDERIRTLTKKSGKSHKKLWQKKEYYDKQVKLILKGLMKKPNSLEQRFIDFLRKYSLPFDYCGNGDLIIGRKNPDFVCNNGKKLLLEVSNKVIREVFEKLSPEAYEFERINHFSKYGWKCLVIWENELKNENKLLEKINNFMEVKSE